MTKRVKGLLASVAVLAVMGGGLTALLLTKPDKNDSSSSETEDTSTPLWHAHSEEISRIEVENPNGDSYTANRTVRQEETTDENGETVTEDVTVYVLDGVDKLPVEDYQVESLATRAPELSSISTIVENATDADFAQYGLDKPIKVKYTVDNAEPIVFYVGSVSPRTQYSYLRLDNDNRIFMVESSAVEVFRRKITEYLSTTLTEAYDKEQKGSQVENIRMHRTDLPYDIYCEFDQYYQEHNVGGGSALHRMIEPKECLLSPEKSHKFTHGLYGLSASEVIKPFPTDADKTAYGLDEPFAEVTMLTQDGKTTKFLIGKSYEDKDGKKLWYGYLDTIDCVYGFTPENAAYINLKVDDIRAKIVVDSFVWDIGKMTYEADGKKWEFEGKGTSADDFVMTYNGQPFENLERYRVLYTFLLKTSAEELLMEEVTPEGSPMVSIKVEEQNDARNYQIDFYDAGGMKAYIAVNGKVLFTCRKSYVNTLIENLNMFEDETKEFIMSW